MDLSKALDELRKQRDDLDEAILSLERLLAGRRRGRGRPPGRKSRRSKKRASPMAHAGTAKPAAE